MQNNDLYMDFNERVIFSLRSLYRSYGFSQYKMSKFEEYDLYAKNKDFLISDNIITFTDTTGKLMALKPDVTLSIVKNLDDNPRTTQKVYYNENVYRVPKGGHAFKEIMQAGLECIGLIDDKILSETITLAAKSLKTITDGCVLDISHSGILYNIFNTFNIDSVTARDIIKCIANKNMHELVSICSAAQLTDDAQELLKLLITLSGNAKDVLPKLKSAMHGKIDISPLVQLENILSTVDGATAQLLRIDFSVTDNTKYYNGIVFKGYVNGIPVPVLSGGQYDNLMKKMKRLSSAVGFAVYLDVLERMEDINTERQAF